MKNNFKQALQCLLKSEGGFVNHPQDPGGMTNCGVTCKTWAEYCNKSIAQISEAEMRSLNAEKVSQLYKENYWDVCKCDDLPAGIDYMVFDFGVNAGCARSKKILQRSLGVAEDGVIGANTLKALNSININSAINAFSLEKEKFYRSLKNFPAFGKGWLNRITEVKKNVVLFK